MENKGQVNKFILKSMMESYTNQDKRNQEITNKALWLLLPLYFMILTGIIQINHQNTTSTILFILLLLINTLSIYCLLRTVNVKNFREMPYNKDLLKYHVDNWSDKEIYDDLIEAYDDVIEYNEETIQRKVESFKKGFLLLQMGLIIYLIYILSLNVNLIL